MHEKAKAILIAMLGIIAVIAVFYLSTGGVDVNLAGDNDPDVIECWTFIEPEGLDFYGAGERYWMFFKPEGGGDRVVRIFHEELEWESCTWTPGREE